MEPHVQYVRTADGVNIAYARFGSGPPLVFLTDPPCSHMLLEWEQAPFPSFFEAFTPRHTLVRYDPRGLGMSDREVVDYSLDARVSDLEAVADGAELERFALIGINNSGPVAIQYSLKHRLRVTRLVLCNTVVNGREQFRPTPRMQALTQLLQTDWEMFTENMVGIAFGWGREDTRRYGAFLRQCVNRPGFLRLYAALAEVNVSAELRHIAVPALVVHQTGVAPVAAGRKVAAEIPGARLVVIDGRWARTLNSGRGPSPSSSPTAMRPAR